MGNITGRGMLRGKVTAIPRVDDTLSKKGQAADALATGNALSKRIMYADVINNLTSTDTDKPLSANMGRELKTAIEQAREDATLNLDQYKETVSQFEQETEDAINEQAVDIAQINESLNKLHFGKTFTYIGDGSTSDREIETGLQCNVMMLVMSPGSKAMVFVPKRDNGGSQTAFAVYSPDAYVTRDCLVKNAEAWLEGSKLVIKPRNEWIVDGSEMTENGFLNGNGETYICYAL